MKIKFYASFAAFLMNCAITLNSPCASTINYSGAAVDLGTVAAGQGGTISNNLTLAGTTADTGYLPTGDSITFTYTLAGLTGGSLTSGAGYNLNSSTGLSGYAYAVSGQAPLSAGYNNGASSTALVLAAANLNPAGTSGTTTITNLSGTAAEFESLFSGIAGLSSAASISYSVSAVPLPAALPMFATVLAGMVGFGVMRRRGMV